MLQDSRIFIRFLNIENPANREKKWPKTCQQHFSRIFFWSYGFRGWGVRFSNGLRPSSQETIQIFLQVCHFQSDFCGGKYYEVEFSSNESFDWFKIWLRLFVRKRALCRQYRGENNCFKWTQWIYRNSVILKHVCFLINEELENYHS